jgi:hypothetical protein
VVQVHVPPHDDRRPLHPWCRGLRVYVSRGDDPPEPPGSGRRLGLRSSTEPPPWGGVLAVGGLMAGVADRASDRRPTGVSVGSSGVSACSPVSLSRTLTDAGSGPP